MIPDTLGGMPVYFDRSLSDLVQVSFPKTKKKRIRRKWAKRPENWREIPKREVWQVGKSFVVHPDYWPEFCRLADVKECLGGREWPSRGAAPHQPKPDSSATPYQFAFYDFQKAIIDDLWKRPIMPVSYDGFFLPSMPLLTLTAF